MSSTAAEVGHTADGADLADGDGADRTDWDRADRADWAAQVRRQVTLPRLP